MRRLLLVAVALLPLVSGGVAAGRVKRPFEKKGEFVVQNVIDETVQAALRKAGLRPASPCGDAVFVRRVHLDVIGILPTSQEVLRFLEDPAPDKRARLIEDLLGRTEFADYWAMKWCDWLRVKAEFPINLWPNAVQAYYRWIHDNLRTNRPFDAVAREMITASGSNFRVPAVNFFRAMQSREPADIARTVALTFLGSRIETWPEDRRDGLAAIFSRVAYKRTIEWKEEIVFTSPEPTGPIGAVLPDGSSVRIPTDRDPRVVFADWLIRPGNPWFTRNIANRVWAWLMGRGIIDEPDDIRPDNPPANPALLTALEKELVLADHDLKHLFRLILNSSTYQQSPIPQSDKPRVDELFAHYIPRQLDAEVLIDAICSITGSTEKYQSPIPEPFTFVPEDNRSVTLSDGSITSPFMEMFGRPSRDTGHWSERNVRPTNGQRLHMLNSRDIQQRIERSWKLGRMMQQARGNARQIIRNLYLTILSREPTDGEIASVEAYARGAVVGRDPRKGRRGRGARAVRLGLKQAVDDLIWALMNSKEFLFRH